MKQHLQYNYLSELVSAQWQDSEAREPFWTFQTFDAFNVVIVQVKIVDRAVGWIIFQRT